MAHYLVQAKLKPNHESDLKSEIEKRSFTGLEPFGRALSFGLENARIGRPGVWLWEEEDYCTPPLKQERDAVLDRFFTAISTERVAEGQGWLKIEHLPRAFPREERDRAGKALVFGTFDALHAGHRYFLRQAKQRADRVVVSLSRDDFVRSVKGRPPVHSEEERSARLQDSGLADEVHLSDRIPGSYGLILQTRPDVICLGWDQDLLQKSLRDWMVVRQWRVPLVRLPRSPEHDSTAEQRRPEAS
ncbi:MAG: adenylyltransferase/cytidyltransferase family protein [Spirochaetales bacterium]|nr:adenylyltransferase/cytidyltransferase family protein [Spirochaetales bacterium]